MDLRKLKTLIDLVSESNISELEITEADGKVRIVKADPRAAAFTAAMPMAMTAAAPAAMPATGAARCASSSRMLTRALPNPFTTRKCRWRCPPPRRPRLPPRRSPPKRRRTLVTSSNPPW